MAQRPAVRYTKGVPVLGQSIHADETDVAFILEKYASQLNQPGHQLWWTPGRGEPGRGIIYDSAGTVHTWPESEATHASMIHVNGYRDQDCSRFYIESNGVVSQIMGPSSAFMTIMRADHELAKANGFAPADPVASYARSLESGA
jgi:hypothetical protein